jgi:hypothetical protein
MNKPVIVSAFEITADGEKGFGVVINLCWVRKFRPLDMFDRDDRDERAFVISYGNGDSEQLFIDPANISEMLGLEEES